MILDIDSFKLHKLGFLWKYQPGISDTEMVEAAIDALLHRSSLPEVHQLEIARIENGGTLEIGINHDGIKYSATLIQETREKQSQPNSKSEISEVTSLLKEILDLMRDHWRGR